MRLGPLTLEFWQRLAKSRPLACWILGPVRAAMRWPQPALGHRVHAVDISPTGLAQIAEDARAQRLAITCERSDLNKFSPSHRLMC